MSGCFFLSAAAWISNRHKSEHVTEAHCKHFVLKTSKKTKKTGSLNRHYDTERSSPAYSRTLSFDLWHDQAHRIHEALMAGISRKQAFFLNTALPCSAPNTTETTKTEPVLRLPHEDCRRNGLHRAAHTEEYDPCTEFMQKYYCCKN